MIKVGSNDTNLKLIKHLVNSTISKQVKGTLISVDEGVRTRSRTKSNPDHWTMVPAPFKIFSVLIDILMIENEGGDDEFGDEVEDETRIHEWDKPLAFIDGRVSLSGKCSQYKVIYSGAQLIRVTADGIRWRVPLQMC